MASKTPGRIIDNAAEGDPRNDESTATPRKTTENTMIPIDTSAATLAPSGDTCCARTKAGTLGQFDDVAVQTERKRHAEGDQTNDDVAIDQPPHDVMLPY